TATGSSSRPGRGARWTSSSTRTPTRRRAAPVARSSPRPWLRRLDCMSVTLLFTDIEGSTRLVQTLGNDYATALEQHRVAVRAALVEHGGEEIDCRGDEFSIAFVDPGQAVAAAEAIQQARV